MSDKAEMFASVSENRIRVFVVVAALAVVGGGCGGSEDATLTHPDTDAGAHETVPATPNCADLCERIAACTVTLCDEDTMTTHYDGLKEPLARGCTASCSDSALRSAITAAQWTCSFQSSCRAFLEADACHGMGHYNCS
jgi:hypothetical protein